MASVNRHFGSGVQPVPKSSVLVQNASASIQEAGAADILVGIPTYNNAETIVPLLKAARSGAMQFQGRRTVIMQADGGSDDSTLQSAKDALSGWSNFIQVSYRLYPVHKLAVSSHAIPGRDSAFETIFSTAEHLGAQACCVIEPGIKSIPPEWIGSLVQPILESGFDFVAPQYLRHKYEGTLITGILYPIVRALFGKQIRQPIGSDFGFSRGFIQHYLSKNKCDQEMRRQAVDLCTTLEAVRSGFKICQALLGARPQVRRDQPPELSTVLMETVGSLFGQVESTAEQWQRVRGSEPVPTFGLRFDAECEDPVIDVTPMIGKFRLGVANLQEIWSLILPPATLLELKKMSRQSDEEFRFPDEFWARTIYDFCVGYHMRTLGRDHLMGALTPLYLGWVASFVLSAGKSQPREVLLRIDNLCKTYEAEKPYLISRWRWPDRFMP
jgi:hypothetical protein